MYCQSCGDGGQPAFVDGMSCCQKCGNVLGEDHIVSEITFGESSTGGALANGTMIRNDQTSARSNPMYRTKGGDESKEQTVFNASKVITRLGTALRLSDNTQHMAARWFRLAIGANFVQGRKTNYVVAACLYIACRVDKTSHMLIDFSDLLEINVFVLGTTYLKLVRLLAVQLPNIDPSLYISRFASLLDFGDETQKVASDATRLVGRMSRDWMSAGRRPAGVCGACLLLAARMNNFRRSVSEVVQVVKIADVTLRKRLGEFKSTESGNLTVDEFRTLWLGDEADPPAFTQSQKRDELARERARNLERILKATHTPIGAETPVKANSFDQERDEAPVDEEDIPDNSQTGRAAFAELAVTTAEGGEDDLGTSDTEAEPAATGNILGDLAGPTPTNPAAPREGSMGPPTLSDKALGKRKRVDQDEDGEDVIDEEAAAALLERANGDQHLLNPVVDDVIAAEVEGTLNSHEGHSLSVELEVVNKRTQEKAAAMTNLNNMDDNGALDQLDEAELDLFILTDAEVEAKSRLWMEFNKDYLQILADKQTGADGQLKPVVKARHRQRNKPRDSTNAQGINAADATKQMMQKKKFSKKINYKAVDDLFSGGRNDRAESIFEVSSPSSAKRGRSSSRAASMIPESTIGTPVKLPRPNFSLANTPLKAVEPPPFAFGLDTVSGKEDHVLEEYELEPEAYEAE